MDNYKSMNLSLYAGDSTADVMTNRKLLADYLHVSIENLYIPFQTHEDNIRLIDKHFLTLTAEEKEQRLHGVDALITQEKNICIGVTTADCVPLIIYDPEKQVLAAVHAGWKGTVKRIAEKAINRMEQEFQSNAESLIVSIGPSISQAQFEVGDEVGETFRMEGFDLNAISSRNNKTGKLHIDLWQANKEQLIQLGVKEENIAIAGICTYRDGNYFSARRQTIHSGRMLTGGVLR